MSNFLSKVSGFLSERNRKKGIRARKTKVFNTDLSLWEARKLPNGHLSCGSCSKPWWFAFNRGNSVIDLECAKCSMSGVLNASDLSFDLNLPTGNFQCPKCFSTKWAIVKFHPLLSIGCKDCPFQTVASLKATQNIILPS